MAAAPRWNPNARRHEVMKAVLLNSADKIQDMGDGRFLGMERTVLDMGDEYWLQSPAYLDVGPGDTVGEVPLDIQMGAGHLNAKRALDQFESGEYNPDGAPVAPRAWDFDTTNGDDDINKYAFAQPLRSNSFISLTLAWDRQVFFDVDGGTPGVYDAGDTFLTDCCFTDLDLYLMPAGATNLNQAVTSSQAADLNDTVEHIFFEISAEAQFEIWVHQASSQFGLGTNYALAWWGRPVLGSGASSGDFSGNGTVGPEDFTIWKSNFGSASAAADGNGNGIVDAADYTIWRDNLGRMVGAGSLAETAVPEPATCLLAVIVLIKFSRRLQFR